MLQSVHNYLRHSFTNRKPGQILAFILLAVSLSCLAALLIFRSNQIVLLLACTAGTFLGLIRLITFRATLNRWVIPASFCLVWLIPLVRVLIGAGGGPLSWDELLYMDLARTAAAEPRVLNQYFHIYLLKIFYWLFGSSDFSAARYYWIVTQSSVLVLVYESAIILTRRYSAFARIISGLAAVVLFACQPLVMEYVGVAYVDFTLELLMTAAAFLLILADARPSFTRTALVLMGILFGLGLKTKEVAVILLIPALGLVWINRPTTFIRRYMLRSAGLFLAGIAAGLVVMIVLNALVLGRPLWGFTPRDLAEWFTVRTGYDPGLKPYYRQSYLTELASTVSVCSLVLIGLILHRRDPATRIGVFRTLLAVIAGFILFYSFIPFQAYTRYLIPIYPLLAILAGPAAAEFAAGQTRSLVFVLFISLPAAVLAWLVRTRIIPTLDPRVFTPEYVYTALILPILLCLFVLGVFVLPTRLPRLRTALLAAILMTAVFYPLVDISRNMAKRNPEKQVTQRFKIIRQWNPDVLNYSDRPIFVSERVNNPLGQMAISADYARIMLNLYFDVDLPVGIVTTRMEQFLQDDLSNYCYGLLPTREFDALPENDREKLTDVFDLSQNNSTLLTYLKNPACQ